MKKFIIYKITFERCWKSLSLGQKVRNLYMQNCESTTFVKYNTHKNSRFFQLVLAKILGNYENKTVCFLDYLIFIKDHIICSGMTLLLKEDSDIVAFHLVFSRYLNFQHCLKAIVFKE